MDVGEDEIKVNGLTSDDIVLLRVGEFRAAEVINEPLLDLLVLGVIRGPRCEGIAGASYIRGDVMMRTIIGVVKVGKIGLYSSFLCWRFRNVLFELVNFLRLLTGRSRLLGVGAMTSHSLYFASHGLSRVLIELSCGRESSRSEGVAPSMWSSICKQWHVLRDASVTLLYSL
jgi:hypothetical protein